MNRQIKQLTLTIFVGLLILFTTSVVSYAVIWGNYSECGYEGECEDPEANSIGVYVVGSVETEKGISIRKLIVESAGHLLNSYSGMLTLLNRIEMSELNGPNLAEIRELTYRVIEDMEKANSTIQLLKTTADQTPYHQPVIQRLLTFNFDGLQMERGLNAVIFAEVKAYLSQGDIRGLYALFLDNSEEILDRLYTLKASVDANKLPDIHSLWRINQDYMSLILLGQHTSEVFEFAL